MEKILIKEDKNGTKYYHCKDRCGKCGGTGYIAYFSHVDGGTCFDCGGSGIEEWDTKEYTPEYEKKLAEQREKRLQKKKEAAIAKAAEANAEFFKKNGFTAEGKTYFVLGNTYEIKDELKAQGAKWDNISSHWHMPTIPEGREVFEVDVNDMFSLDWTEAYHWSNTVRREWDDPEYYVNKIKKAEELLKARESTSQHVGVVGEKLDIAVTYTHTASWENSYGGWLNHESVTNLHTFKDEQGNIFVWKTGLYIDADYGTKMRLKGTIKEHSAYKGIKQTVMTRCKLGDI